MLFFLNLRISFFFATDKQGEAFVLLVEGNSGFD